MRKHPSCSVALLASSEPTRVAGIEAVFNPSRMDRAEENAKADEARNYLKLAVRERERARESADLDPEDSLKAFKGLVSARWTLLDHYESGGTRYVLVRENSSQPSEPAGLSGRERQVAALAALGRSNKFIAYELGLAHSTVRVLIARACSKLGITSRAELIALQAQDEGLHGHV